MTLGDRLAEVRKKAGLSTRALDRLAGLTEGHCWIIEKKNGNTAASTIDSLARVLGCSLDYLVRGEGESPTEEAIRAAVAAARARSNETSEEPSDDEDPAARDRALAAIPDDADRESTLEGYENGATEPPFTDSTPTNPEASSP